MLIFDEVMTGFRVAWGGAQVLYNIKPDITCLGKVIGGGLPVGAYAARRELMEMISPSGSVYQAGTLSGNPLAMAAGIATLEILQEPGAYETLEQRSVALAEGLQNAADSAKIPVMINRVGSMICPFFVTKKDQSVTSYARSDRLQLAALRQVFPRHAQPRRLSPAQPIRSLVRRRCPRRKRDQIHDQSCERGVQNTQRMTRKRGLNAKQSLSRASNNPGIRSQVLPEKLPPPRRESAGGSAARAAYPACDIGQQKTIPPVHKAGSNTESAAGWSADQNGSPRTTCPSPKT